ncbi:GNAT family N-acetyltransferase [Rhodobaculum claviforme]|uniref:GNAT family N-acetyltransferase n=1 Tax=Rhodobaculum claviforme TaxID=1549854 RepID=A0A934TIH2_9RHOB|nr:GNAT family N-acetyltransferase [Rhodobaculum claviforme]MBK5926111.1 GNAT family N-acetyltransferase [Rhodobaculum claviforme]
MTQPPAPLIRPVTPADRDAWAALWRQYLAFYRTELPEATYDTLFARLLAPGPDGPFGLLADIDGRPVGLVHYLFHLHCWKPEGVVYLQDLFTDPAARGRGVAGALITAVYAAGDAAGRPSVYWMTQRDNATARALYDRVAVPTDFMRYIRG